MSTVLQPVVIEPAPVRQQPPKLGLGAALQVKAAANRIAVMARLKELGGEAIERINVETATRVEHQTVAMERSDAVASRLGEDVAQAHQTAKINAAMRQYQLGDQAGAAVQETILWLISRVQRMPAGMFYTPNTRERLRALWQNTYAELEMRPGCPRLTPRQHLKELFIGGEVDRLVTTYDQLEMQGWQQQLDVLPDGSAAGEAAALAAPPAPRELPAGELDEATVNRLLDLLLAQRQPQEVE